MNNNKNLDPETNKTFCYWSIGDNSYRFILKSLVRSARNAGVTEDFHVWSDKNIEGAYTHFIDDSDLGNLHHSISFPFEFKFKYLLKMLNLNYDYYIYLDADSYFVRKPRNPLTLLKGDPMHVFLETDLAKNENLIRSDWWGCPLPILVKEMQKMGVEKKKIYNINGGFFIINKEYVRKMFDLVYSFNRHMCGKGYTNFADEPCLSYAMHMLCKDTENHLFKDNLDIYGLDTEDVFNKELPNGQPWKMNEWFTLTSRLVNPAIIHCFYSKILLTNASKNIFEKIFYRN